MPISQDISTKLSVPAPDKMIFAYTEEHASIQDAIDFAETLSAASDPTDLSGVGIFIPAGYYAEDLIIRKNVSLFGQGQLVSSVSSVTYRPSDDTAGPFASSVSNLWIRGQLLIEKETDVASGIFNYFVAQNRFIFFDCEIGSVLAQSSQLIAFYSCKFDGATVLNSVQDATFQNCQLADLTYAYDETSYPSTYTDFYLLNSNLNLFNSQVSLGSTLTMSTVMSVLSFAYLYSRNSYISNLVQGDQTAHNIEGGLISARSITGSVSGSTFNVPHAPVLTTRAAPQLIVGPTFTALASHDQLIHIAGDSAPQTITDIGAGQKTGDRVRMICVDSVNTVEFQPSATIIMPKGALTMVDGDYIEFVWDGDALWIEATRNR